MIPLSVSEKLLRLAGGEQLPASTLKHAIVDELIAEGIISERITGRTKRTLYITDAKVLDVWLFNRHTINNLSEYIAVLKNEAANRADLVLATNDSKTQTKRTYTGFLVNSYAPVECTLNGQPFNVHPTAGTFHFIYDFENFVPATDVTIVGIENMENFRFVERQAYLFENINSLFVCRYPQEQSKDLMKWLLSISNKYLHFGDCDFAGINIYLNEYKKHLNDRASFFIPPNIEELLSRNGNPKLYDQQQLSQTDLVEDGIMSLISLLHKHKKGLEQEVLILL